MVREYGLCNFYFFCLHLPDLSSFYFQGSPFRVVIQMAWHWSQAALVQILANSHLLCDFVEVNLSVPHFLNLSSGDNIGTYLFFIRIELTQIMCLLLLAQCLEYFKSL